VTGLAPGLPTPGSPASEVVLRILRERRTVFQFRADPVPAELVEQALDAGRWAPNHKLTEPWRFTVLGPDTRATLTPLFTAKALRKLPPDATPERREQALAQAAAKWEGKPVVVVVSQTPEEDPLRREEDYASVSCAIQNIQLAAWALGLGSQWSTNPLVRDGEAMRLAGIPQGERVAGILFLGVPAVVPESRRKGLDQVLRRMP